MAKAKARHPLPAPSSSQSHVVWFPAPSRHFWQRGQRFLHAIVVASGAVLPPSTHTHDSNPDADADAHKFDGLPGKESDLRFDGGVGGRPNPDAAIWTISLSDKGTRPHPHQMT
jgi:hypothetical protein